MLFCLPANFITHLQTNMRKSLLVILLSYCTIASNHAIAQSNAISVDAKEEPFYNFISTLENKTSYYFFYDSSVIENFFITLQLENVSVFQIIDTVLKLKGYHYIADKNFQIFITGKQPFQADLVNNFFQQESNSDNSNVTDPELNEDSVVIIAPAVRNIQEGIINIGIKSGTNQGIANISGYISDNKSGEAIAGAYIYFDSTATGTITDKFGYYSLTISKGRHTIYVTSIGMDQTSQDIMMFSNGKLNIELKEYIPTLKNVVVKSERSSNTKSLLAGVERLDIKTIKKIPPVLGEADVIKALFTLPGVTSVGEGSSGFNVRGGSTDQNLILFNDATIYNPSHLFGFFSAFNSEVVKSVELYKSAIPEKFGGRISSVLDVTSREGNKKKVNLSGGIGPLTSKLTLEGPLVKDKSSFLLSARTTYSDWILKAIRNTAYNNSTASFNDITLYTDYVLNKNNSLFLTAYTSNDQFRLNSDTLFKYGNRNINVKWKHIFNSRLLSVLTAGLDNYQYAISADGNPLTAFKLKYTIRQYHTRLDFNYTINNQHALNFGVNSIYYKLSPGSFQPLGAQSITKPNDLQQENALETAFYFGDKYTITPNLSISAGLRYSIYNYLGGRNVYTYLTGFPKDQSTITDTVNYGAGKIIQTYHGPEARLAIRYSLPGNASIKFSYNSLRQYINLLSNTTSISPTDTWKLSDTYIKPQTGNQISLGFYKNFSNNMFETSVEVYYKQIKNYPDYKSGSTLLMNQYIETAIIESRGKAYGAELLIKKPAGRLNGWLSYTWSRTWLQTDDDLAGEQINNGAYYPAGFDRPHNANLVLNYAFSHRFSVSGTFVYNTGRPVTLPVAIFYINGAERVLYSDRNAYRIPDYIRSDISFSIEPGHKLKKFAHSSWSFGAYNLLGRKNPYSVYFTQENGSIKGYKISIFGSVIPFISYNFKL